MAFLTGHCGLNQHLKAMVLREDAECRFFLSSDETFTRLYGSCKPQEKATGHFILNIKQARKLDPVTILCFLKSCGLLASV